MKKSFTLIEVLMAVIIIFIAVGAVIGISSNTKHLFQILINKKNFNLLSTITFTELNNRKNLYEEALDFNITDDELISYLKSKKINTIENLDYMMEFNLSEGKKTVIKINKIKVYDKEYSNYVYGMDIK